MDEYRELTDEDIAVFESLNYDARQEFAKRWKQNNVIRPFDKEERKASIYREAVNNPKKASDRQVGGNHYKDMPIQPGHYIRRNDLGWYEGNIVKYITRYKQKGGVEDVKKVIHYAELILEEMEDERQKELPLGNSFNQKYEG